MEDQYYAHSRQGKPPREWQPLDEHLKNVAELARAFANDFDSGDWAYLAGLWHDLGKYSEEFQDHLKRENDIEAISKQHPGGWITPAPVPITLHGCCPYWAIC